MTLLVVITTKPLLELVQTSAPGGELPQALAFGHGCRAVGGLLDGEERLVLIAAVQPDRELVSLFAKADLLPASGRLDLPCHHPVTTGVAEEADLLGDVPPCPSNSHYVNNLPPLITDCCHVKRHHSPLINDYSR